MTKKNDAMTAKVAARVEAERANQRQKGEGKPVAVRYCFHDFQPGTMIGGNELPLIPFRTDEW